MKTVAIVIFDTIMASSVTGPADMFTIANNIALRLDPSLEVEPFDVKFVSLDNESIAASSHMSFSPTLPVNQLENADLILIGGHRYVNQLGLSQHLAHMKGFEPYLVRANDKGAFICTFCTGSFSLAQSGLLDNGNATVSWWLAPQFKRDYPKVNLILEQLIVKSGNIWTAGATTAYTNLCLSLIEKLANPRLANQLSRVMLLDNNRLSQLPYMSTQDSIGHNDTVISGCQRWLQQRYESATSIKAMSEYCAMSERTFIRRFKAAVGMTPLSYLQQIRVDTAKQLLESTTHSLEHIVNQVGYDDVSAFRRLFVKLTQLTPRAYRSAFSNNQIQLD